MIFSRGCGNTDLAFRKGTASRLLEVSVRRLTHPIVIAFALLVVVGIALSSLVRTQEHDHAIVQHTMEVREALGSARLSLFEAETGMRGYLITGREDYLAPYLKARDMLPLHLGNLQKLTADNPAQQAAVAKLKPIVDELLPTLQSRIDTFRTSGQAAALASITGITKTLADEANGVLEGMLAEEARLLVERQAASERTSNYVQGLALVTLIFAIIFGALNAVESSRRRKEIEAGHAALHSSHERLKTEVKERETIEFQLRQAQKMEAVGQLTGGVAHDFNNMLAVVIGALDIARKRISQGDGNILTLIESAIEGAKRGALLTQRLLAFSRQQALEPKVLHINKLLSGLSDMLRRSLSENIRIEIVQGAGLWRTYADAHQLENALVNLAVNARDAMPNGGKLTIETENAVLDERYAADHAIAPGHYVMISISDTGTGMPPDVVARAFDPFFTTKAVGQGNGLGLSMVFGFVKQSGGHIKIYSELNQGTAVKIYLPRHESAEAFEDETRPVPRDELATHTTAKVLVVEDDDTVRLLTVASVEELGFMVFTANGAGEALRILAANTDIALLVTDVVMPEVSGRQLAEEARNRLPHLKVLYTTGYTRNAIVHNGALDPGVHLLSKPFTLEQLSQAIHRVMGT